MARVTIAVDIIWIIDLKLRYKHPNYRSIINLLFEISNAKGGVICSSISLKSEASNRVNLLPLNVIA